MDDLSASIKKETKTQKSKDEGESIILVGHLIPDLAITPDLVVVIRISLAELIKRLEERKYPKDKIRENIVSESVDYCGARSNDRWETVYEIETDGEKKEMISYISDIINGSNSTPPKKREIDKLEEILDLVYEGNKYSL